MRYVLTFASVHFVMKAARILKTDGFDAIIIPIPRKISSECGMALEIQCDDVKRIKEFLETKSCGMTGVYNVEANGRSSPQRTV